MATSSIIENVRISNPKEIEEFVDALEASANDPDFDYSAPKHEFVTDKNEIMKIMRKRYFKDE